jgi:hypothetical protein
MKTWVYLAVFIVTVGGLVPASAWADDDDGRFASPPQGRHAPVAVAYDDDPGPVIATEPERPRSAARVAVGPIGVTTGKGMGLGVGGALDLGKGSVGGRISAAWARGEPGGGSLASESFSQYAGELVLDLKKSGPVHPLLGIGFGVIHAENAHGSGFAGVGLVRAGVEYALGFEETDVRLGLSATGGLVGPADHEIEDLRAHAVLGAHVAIGL